MSTPAGRETLKAWQMDPYTLESLENGAICCCCKSSQPGLSRSRLSVVLSSVAFPSQGQRTSLALVEGSKEGRRERRRRQEGSVRL